MKSSHFMFAFLLNSIGILASVNGTGIVQVTNSTSVDTLYKPQQCTGRLSKTAVFPSVRFSDPIPAGSSSYFCTISNYKDLDNSASGLKDYSCGQVTYDGHQGTDFDLIDFYEMDEGYPAVCAADGTVYSVHDGFFDRNTILNPNDTSNSVTIVHADGSWSAYLHFRNGTIRVQKGQSVKTGDTLGLIGSSGYSTGPHLHFEVGDNTNVIIDPFNGTCQSSASLWKNQPPYLSSRSTDILTHGLTSLPLSHSFVMERPAMKKHFTAGDTVKSWIKIRNIKAGDTLTWLFRFGTTEVWKETFGITQSYSSSWWYTWYYPFQTSSYFGTWNVSIQLNKTTVATDYFTYDQLPNALPQIDLKSFTPIDNVAVIDSLSGTDPDGEIFCYTIAAQPKHGVIELFGGRNRKIRYTPISGFSGYDTAYVYALGDNNEKGDTYPVFFKVGQSAKSVAPMVLPRSKRIKATLTDNNLCIDNIPAAVRTIALYDITGARIFAINVFQKQNTMLSIPHRLQSGGCYVLIASGIGVSYAFQMVVQH